MKLIKPILISIAIFFTISAIMQFIIFLTPEVKGKEEQFNPDYHLDLTYSYDFTGTTTMSATVPPNKCNTCLKYERPSNCLHLCNIIID